jgi:PIN domain nuclease of toxin-antitoxin system
MICLDTHAFVWMAIAPAKLSAKALKVVNDESEFLIADITIWEISVLIHKQRLTLPLPFEEFMDLAIGSRNYTIAPITPAIAFISSSLMIHKDPADRLICATAIHHKVKLITKDREIIKSAVVETVW